MDAASAKEKAVEKGVIIEQKLSTVLHKTVDKGAEVVTVTSKDLGEVQTLLEICERWGLTAVLDKRVEFSAIRKDPGRVRT